MPSLLQEADYFFWNNFRGLYKQTKVQFEGIAMDLQDALFSLMEKYRKPGSIIIAMYPICSKRDSPNVIIDR